MPVMTSKTKKKPMLDRSESEDKDEKALKFNKSEKVMSTEGETIIKPEIDLGALENKYLPKAEFIKKRQKEKEQAAKVATFKADIESKAKSEEKPSQAQLKARAKAKKDLELQESRKPKNKKSKDVKGRLS